MPDDDLDEIGESDDEFQEEPNPGRGEVSPQRSLQVRRRIEDILEARRIKDELGDYLD